MNTILFLLLLSLSKFCTGYNRCDQNGYVCGGHSRLGEQHFSEFYLFRSQNAFDVDNIDWAGFGFIPDTEKGIYWRKTEIENCCPCCPHYWSERVNKRRREGIPDEYELVFCQCYNNRFASQRFLFMEMDQKLWGYKEMKGPYEKDTCCPYDDNEEYEPKKERSKRVSFSNTLQINHESNSGKRREEYHRLPDSDHGSENDSNTLPLSLPKPLVPLPVYPNQQQSYYPPQRNSYQPPPPQDKRQKTQRSGQRRVIYSNTLPINHVSDNDNRRRKDDYRLPVSSNDNPSLRRNPSTSSSSFYPDYSRYQSPRTSVSDNLRLSLPIPISQATLPPKHKSRDQRHSASTYISPVSPRLSPFGPVTGQTGATLRRSNSVHSINDPRVPWNLKTNSPFLSNPSDSYFYSSPTSSSTSLYRSDSGSSRFSDVSRLSRTSSTSTTFPLLHNPNVFRD